MLGASAEIGDQAQPLASTGDQIGVDPVGHGRHQHVAILHRLGQLLARERHIACVQHHIEQLAHPRFDLRHQVAGDDHARDIGERTGGALGHG